MILKKDGFKFRANESDLGNPHSAPRLLLVSIVCYVLTSWQFLTLFYITKILPFFFFTWVTVTNAFLGNNKNMLMLFKIFLNMQKVNTLIHIWTLKEGKITPKNNCFLFRYFPTLFFPSLSENKDIYSLLQEFSAHYSLNERSDMQRTSVWH